MTVGAAAALADLAVRRGDHLGEVRFEPFDSELLALAIGRVHLPVALPRREAQPLLLDLADAAAGAGFDQLIRRVPASSADDIWSLESTGYELMDIGVTFVRRLGGRLVASATPDVAVRPGTPDDVERLLVTMLDVPWGSRYEADPAYDPDAVRTLRARWLRNSLAGRADRVLVGQIDGEPAGFVTCRLVEEHDETIGEIDLVGTVPAFRGRGVAAAIVDHSFAWFSERVEIVTVRTQATNTTAAGAYERAGMTLRQSDLTFRLALTALGGKQ